MHRTHATGALRIRAAVAAGSALLVAAVATSAATPQQRDNAWFADSHPAAPAHDAPAPTGALATYGSLTEFLAATASVALSHEDFEGGYTPANGIRVCFQAVASGSDDPCFKPGDLVAGFGIRSSGGNIWDPASGVDSDLVVLGAGTRGMPSTVVGANVPDPPTNPTEITFDAPRTAVAMDVYEGFSGAPVQIEAYGVDDQLAGVFMVSPASSSLPAFAGFTSAIPIRRVAIEALGDGTGELVDNLYFGGGAGHLAVSAPASGDFDAVALGHEQALAITVTNDGGIGQAVGAIAALAAPFSITNDTCSNTTLAAGASCTLQLMFSPEYASEFQASIEIPATGTDAARYDIRGEGVRARLSPAPGVLDFANTNVSGTVSRTLTISNLTGGDLDVASIAPPSGPFAQNGGSCPPPPFSLAPGDTCTLDYTFAPIAPGQFDAAATITSSGSPATTTVNLHGTGV
ncbi:MAG: choice-of-anchor D domain-containing protein [Rhodanobacteraceae bacterium]